MAQPQVQIIDCTSDPQTSYSRTIPDDAWLTQIVMDGVGLSGADVPLMNLDSVITGYRRAFHVANVGSADDVTTETRVLISSLSGTVHSSHTTLIGALLVAPTYYHACYIDVGDTSVQRDTGMQLAATAHSFIKIGTLGGVVTFNSGFIYLVHYIRAHEIIESVDFSAVTENSHDFAVGNHSSLCLLAPGLLFGVADEPQTRVSTDGITFDSGATDYETGFLNSSAQAALNDDNFYKTSRSATTQDFAIHMEGFNLTGAVSCVVNGASLADANTGPFQTTSIRTAAQKNTHLRLFSLGANNFTGGTAFLIGAK